MADVATVETESGIIVLSAQEARKAAILLNNSIRNIVSSWEEYKNPRLIEQGGIREFVRHQGLDGEGLWQVIDYGPYCEYHLINSREDTTITIQPGGEKPYTDPVLSIQRKIKQGEGQISESPPKNSKLALGEIVRFVKEISRGQIPPELSTLL